VRRCRSQSQSKQFNTLEKFNRGLELTGSENGLNDLNRLNDLNVSESEALLHRDAFRQISRLVNVRTAMNRDVVSEQL
jgi:hypothetical protein